MAPLEVCEAVKVAETALLQLHLGLEAKACIVAACKRLVLGVLLEVKHPGARIMRVECNSKD
jgi:hypothetical protein